MSCAPANATTAITAACLSRRVLSSKAIGPPAGEISRSFGLARSRHSFERSPEIRDAAAGGLGKSRRVTPVSRVDGDTAIEELHILRPDGFGAKRGNLRGT